MNNWIQKRLADYKLLFFSIQSPIGVLLIFLAANLCWVPQALIEKKFFNHHYFSRKLFFTCWVKYSFTAVNSSIWTNISAFSFTKLKKKPFPVLLHFPEFFRVLLFENFFLHTFSLCKYKSQLLVTLSHFTYFILNLCISEIFNNSNNNFLL